jgi:hypothetical protein
MASLIPKSPSRSFTAEEYGYTYIHHGVVKYFIGCFLNKLSDESGLRLQNKLCILYPSYGKEAGQTGYFLSRAKGRNHFRCTLLDNGSGRIINISCCYAGLIIQFAVVEGLAWQLLLRIHRRLPSPSANQNRYF